MRAFFLGLLLLLPMGVNAAVSISEVAWMGSIDSANHEWAELHNNGPATDVTGWILRDGVNFEIELSGTIPENSYAVLERTSDASAPGTAFFIYTGALVNTGATLKLERSDGSLVDQVPSGENWENIGGDNVTKETAQYTNSGWKTAPATPGSGLEWNDDSENTDKLIDEDEPEAAKNTNTSKKGNSGESVRLLMPGVSLDLAVDAQTIGYVHQKISFDVEPSGIGESLINSLVYQWNFGDGSVSTEKYSKHVFDYPGTYIVTVYAVFKRQEQVARHEITILPVQISLTTNREGDVQVNNDSPYELDISGYRLRGEKSFTFPSYSILLPNQTVTISKERLGKTKSRMIAIYDTEKSLVSSVTTNTLAFSSTEVRELVAPSPQISAISFSQVPTETPDSNFTFAPKSLPAAESIKEERFVEVALTATTTQIANAGAAVPDSDSRSWYLALVGVLVLGILGVYATPRRNQMS
ncbi:MAG: hypothetical protein ACI9BF_000516 [Candidatus Paceibacteria bacterium]|jgi:hypothetical protein